MTKTPLEFTIPENAIKVTSFKRSESDESIIARVIELPADDNYKQGMFIAQDSRSSLGFGSFDDAVKFLATFNR